MITVVGLGPGDLSELQSSHSAKLLDPAVRIFVRTMRHPAAEQLAERRPVEACDDLYEASEHFEAVYDAIATRVVGAAGDGEVVYAVPGSPLIAERSVGRIRQAAKAAGIAVEVVPGISFLDLMFAELDFDPAAAGFQLLDGRDLPSPLFLHVPTVVFHVDLPVVLADVVDRLRRTVSDDTPVHVVSELGTPDASVQKVPLGRLNTSLAGPRTSLFFDGQPVGIPGLISVMQRLRRECPWDRQQTHHSLARHAIEETFELVEAVAALSPDAPDPNHVDEAYGDVEEELGDVLLQVIFHSNLAAEARAFDIDDVAEQTRRKLVKRHPHVFGDVEVAGAADVVANWEDIKAEGKPDRQSALDGVPVGLPALDRAAKIQRRAATVGFDWDASDQVLEKLDEEIGELRAALRTEGAADELGDVLFTAVNLARHLDLDGEVVLRRAIERFELRFRWMESEDDLASMSLDQLEERWQAAKGATGSDPKTA